jgi:O-antigen/teichoic acid export membrane protein
MEQPLENGTLSHDVTDRNLLGVAKQATGVMTFRFVGTLVGLGSNLIFARFLGAELLGVVVIASTVLLVVTLIASLGFGNTFVRYVPVSLSRGDREGAAGVFRLGVRSVLLASIVAGVIVWFLRDFLAYTVFKEPLLLAVMPIVAVGAVPATLYILFGFGLRALKRTAMETFSKEIVFKIVKLAAFLALFYLGYKFRGLMVGFVGGYAVAMGVMLFLMLRNAPFLLRGRSTLPAPARELFAFSGMMLFVGVMNYGMSITDRVMLGILSTSEAVGVYNIAFLISNILSLIFMALNESFSPVISELYHNDRREELRSLYSSLTRAVLLIILPAFIWLVGFGDDLLRYFGGDFVAGYWALVVLGIGVMTRCFVGTVGPLLVLSGHERWNAANIVIVTGMNIGLNLYFIPRYGVLGAAFATAISLVAINIVALLEVRALLGLLPYARSYWKLLLPSAVTLAGVLWLRANTPDLRFWMITLLLFAEFGVFLGLTAVQGFERDDKLILGKIFARVGLGRGGGNPAG